MIGMKKTLKRMLAVLLLSILAACMPVSVQATTKRTTKKTASQKTTSKKTAAKKKTTSQSGKKKAAIQKNGWVKKKNRFYYYHNGKPLKGWQRLSGHTYYFGGNGVQRTSWRKIDNSFYCFGPDGGQNGYLLVNTQKNGITIGSNGKAQNLSGRAARKVKAMARISVCMDKIVGNGLAREKRLRRCYDYLRREVPYRSLTHYRKKDSNRDLWYVEAFLYYKYADCHMYASAFAYLANAIGYDNVVLIHALQHSWVRINGYYYDVSIGRLSPYSYRLFRMRSYNDMIDKYHYKVKTRRNLSKL